VGVLGGLHVARECGAGAWRRCGWTSPDWQHVLSHPWCGGRRCSPTPWLGRRRVGMGRHYGGPEELLVCVEDVSERVQVVRSFTAVVTAEAIPHLSCKLW
jgi:hypothetical protein